MDENTKNTTTEDTTTTSSTTATSTSTAMPVLLVVVAVVILIGAVLYFGLAQPAETPAPADGTNTAQAVTEYPDVVAVIDGEAVSREDFMLSLRQAQQAAVQQGADMNDPATQTAVESQALDILVNTKLLAAAAASFVDGVTDEQVDAQIAVIGQSYETPEAFAEAIAGMGLSDEQLRSDLRDQIAIEAYLNEQPSFTTATVSEAEVAEAYETLSAQSPGLPELADIAELIEQQLVAQKQQQAVSDIIDTLKNEAEIEVNI